MRILIVKVINNEFWRKPEWVEIDSLEEIEDYKAKGYEIIDVEEEKK